MSWCVLPKEDYKSSVIAGVTYVGFILQVHSNKTT